MSSDLPARPAADTPSPNDDLRSDVRDILSDALQWRLPAARWAGVESLVQALHDAVQAGDLERLEAVLGDLELAAPLRITPIGGDETTPATPRLRNLAERVVHDLGEGIEPGPVEGHPRTGDENDATGR